jgi:hypothetical protein
MIGSKFDRASSASNNWGCAIAIRTSSCGAVDPGDIDLAVEHHGQFASGRALFENDVALHQIR